MQELRVCPWCHEPPEIKANRILEDGRVTHCWWYVEHTCPSFAPGDNRLRTRECATQEAAIGIWNGRM